MASAARKSDIAKGHDCFPDTLIIEGSPDVIINGQPAARLGDSVAPHSCTCSGGHGIHTRNIAEGAPTTFINGRPAATTGNGIDCGGKIISGSPDVIIGSIPFQSPVHGCAEDAVLNCNPLLSISPPLGKLPPEPLPLPALIYQTKRQMDDYQAKDMQSADLDILTLKNRFHINMDDVSLKINPETLELKDLEDRISLNSPYAIPGLHTRKPIKVSYQESGALMFDEFRKLAKVFSFHGEYKNVITEMINHMQSNSGIPYTNPLLDKALEKQIKSDHSDKSSLLSIKDVIADVIDFEYKFIPLKRKKEFEARINQEAILPKFDQLIDRTNGLVITVHDTWSTHITLESLVVTGDTYHAKINYKVQDHFGLDDQDIQNKIYREFRIFRLWFVLQRCKQYGYKPFITEMNATVEISGRRND